MALIQRRRDAGLIRSLLVLLCLHTSAGMSGWGGCLDGQDVFTTIRENSLSGEVVAELMAETTMEGVHWMLNGKDADWFFLDERGLRLNTSADKVLDREAHGPVLMAELLCYEDDTLQTVYRIMVEILNENDNPPAFADAVVSLSLSELTAVNTVVFSVQATDADKDKMIYSIDQTSPDAEYFKIDLPNSGEVVLSKPLDYETKSLLSVTIRASEMSTAERFNTSTNISITVLDGDDQYPQFLPCLLLFQDETNRICSSPVYSANVTEGQQDVLLDFSPGPIHAVDGDRGLCAPVSYSILSGDEDGRFQMDGQTGAMRLIQGVRDRLTTPVLHLQVMAYQDDDPRKYSVATVLVRFLPVNQFYPQFDMTEYRGFVAAGKSPASLVHTYGSKTLMLHVEDQDFDQGFNPMIHFTFSPTSNHTDIFQITHEGFLIARTNKLKAQQKHVLEVMAADRDSGETTFATVVVEVLSEGQSIPYGPLGAEHVIGCTLGKAFFLSMVFMTLIGCILTAVMWLKRKHLGKRDPLQRGCVAQGKHPNVSLRWFQLMSQRNAMPHMDEMPYSEDYGTYNPSFSFTDKPGIYTHQDLPQCRGPVPPRVAAAPDTSFIETEATNSPAGLNHSVSTPAKCRKSFSTFQPVEVSQTQRADAPPSENPTSPTETSPAPTEASATEDSATGPEAHDGADTPPFTRPDTQTPQTADRVTSPSSQSSIPCSHTRIAAAEIDKPFCKPRVKTPPYSPLQSARLPRLSSTPPATPESVPPHVEAPAIDNPPATPEPTAGTLNSSELDPTDQSEPPDGAAGAGSRQQDCPEAGEGGDDGVLGDEDRDKNNEEEDDDELESDEEELLRVLARCNPIFLTFTK